jgi:transposase
MGEVYCEVGLSVHGVDAAGAVVIRKRVSRAKVLEYFGALPPCLVGIEACPSAQNWGRELQGIGHTVRLIPPSYVKASSAARTTPTMRERSARRRRGLRCGSSRSRRRSSRPP